MPKLWIDNRPVEVDAGTTILDAAARLGIEIPTLCFRHGCTPETSCLVCLVRVNSAQRLVPACATQAADGMQVESQTPQVMAARTTALELLLGDHAGDCLAPCQTICPAHMDIPRMMRQIAAGQWRQALITVKQDIALPAVLGWICPAMCQKGCRRGQKDAPVGICALQRSVADADLSSPMPFLPVCPPASGKRVAIVGAGPAGLAAAYYLRQSGHACSVFDAHPQAGGNLRYAIGEDRLPRAVLDAEIALIQKLGVDFHFGVHVGVEVSVADLRRQFDAVLLAVGTVEAAGTGAAQLGLPLAGRVLQVDKTTLLTGLDGVFAAGAAIVAVRHTVRSVASGKRAAEVIDQYVRGQAITPPKSQFTVRLGALSERQHNTGAPHIHAGLVGGAGASLTPEEAAGEASRCLGCDCGSVSDCRLRRYAIQYHANPSQYQGERRCFERIISHLYVIYEPGKCITCGLCVQITARSGEPLGLTYMGRGFDVRIGVPFNESLGEALQRVAQECIDACPTGALDRPGNRSG